MKYHILHDFRTSTPFKDLHKVRLLIDFDTNLTSSPGRVTNLTFDTLFIIPRSEIRLTSKFVRSFSLRRSLKRSGFFLKWSTNSKVVQNVVFRVKFYTVYDLS